MAGIDELKATAAELFKLCAESTPDYEKILSFYCDDAKMMIPFADTAVGHAALLKLFKQETEMIKDRSALKDNTEETVVFGDYGFERGTFETKSADGSREFKGRYLVIWKKIGGKWKLYTEAMTPISIKAPLEDHIQRLGTQIQTGHLA